MNEALYNKPLILQRADPFVMKHKDGWYYFTATVPTYDAIELRRSKTLEGLSEAPAQQIWKKHDQGPMSEHIWAPEIHYLDGRWLIYFAASEADDIWKLRPYILECEGGNPLEDVWVEKGMVQAAKDDPYSFTDFSLDGTVFEVLGVKYFVWAQKVGGEKGISNLYISKMASPYQLETIQVLLTTPDYDWERVDFWVNEGPAVFFHEDRIILTFSASATGACYCMGYLEAKLGDDLLDPRVWNKCRYPIVTTEPEHMIYGPGHNSFTVDEEGQLMMVYHARTYEKIEGNPLYDHNRHTMIRPVDMKLFE